MMVASLDFIIIRAPAAGHPAAVKTPRISGVSAGAIIYWRKRAWRKA